MSSRDRSFCAFVHPHPQHLVQPLARMPSAPPSCIHGCQGSDGLLHVKSPWGPAMKHIPGNGAGSVTAVFTGLAYATLTFSGGSCGDGPRKHQQEREGVREGQVPIKLCPHESPCWQMGSESGELLLRSCSPRAREPEHGHPGPSAAHQGCSPSQHCCPAESGAEAPHLVPYAPSLTPHSPFPAAVTHADLFRLRTSCSFCQGRPFCPALPCWLLLSLRCHLRRDHGPPSGTCSPSLSPVAPSFATCRAVLHWFPGYRGTPPQEPQAPGSTGLSLLHCYVQ